MVVDTGEAIKVITAVVDAVLETVEKQRYESHDPLILLVPRSPDVSFI